MTVSVWAVAYFCRLPAVMAPSWLVLGLMLCAVAWWGYRTGAKTAAGWLGGVMVGTVSAILNMLILGSLLASSDGGVVPSALWWVPGSILAVALLVRNGRGDRRGSGWYRVRARLDGSFLEGRGRRHLSPGGGGWSRDQQRGRFGGGRLAQYLRVQHVFVSVGTHDRRDLLRARAPDLRGSRGSHHDHPGLAPLAQRRAQVASPSRHRLDRSGGHPGDSGWSARYGKLHPQHRRDRHGSEHRAGPGSRCVRPDLPRGHGGDRRGHQPLVVRGARARSRGPISGRIGFSKGG